MKALILSALILAATAPAHAWNLNGNWEGVATFANHSESVEFRIRGWFGGFAEGTLELSGDPRQERGNDDIPPRSVAFHVGNRPDKRMIIEGRRGLSCVANEAKRYRLIMGNCFIDGSRFQFSASLKD